MCVRVSLMCARVGLVLAHETYQHGALGAGSCCLARHCWHDTAPVCTLRSWNDSMPPDGRLELRLADLSHAELLRVATIGCGESRAAMAEANRMLSATKPLPAWAVDQVLLSPDLLPKLLSVCIGWNKGGAPSSHGLQDRAASAVCRAWRAAWARQLDVERICRVLGTLCDGLEFMSPTGGAALSDVSFCVASHSLDGSTLDIVTRPRVTLLATANPNLNPNPNPNPNP